MALSSLPGLSQGLSHGLSTTPGLPGKQTPALPWQITGVIWPPGASGLSKWSFNGAWLSPAQAESNLALADYWSQLVLPWQITGIIRSWEFGAEP